MRILLWEVFFSDAGTTERKGATSAVNVLLYRFRCHTTPLPDHRCHLSGFNVIPQRAQLGKAQGKTGIPAGGCQLRFPLPWMFVFPNSKL